MDFVYSIIIIVVFLALMFAGQIALNRFLNHRNTAKYDRYNRDLSEREVAFIAKASDALDKARQVDFPKAFGIFLYTAYVPTMFLCWAVLAGSTFLFFRAAGYVPPKTRWVCLIVCQTAWASLG